MKTEIWKDIAGYEGLYQVSNYGRVLSLNYRHTGRSELLSPVEDKDGYLKVGLWKNGKRKFFTVHRLVVEAFLPNPENKQEVNHIDEDKKNNRVDNLEWCSAKENCNHGTRNERVAEKNTNGKLSKAVLQLSLTGELIREWPSTQECKRNGFNQAHITSCCSGKLKSHKGFRWEYK